MTMIGNLNYCVLVGSACIKQFANNPSVWVIFGYSDVGTSSLRRFAPQIENIIRIFTITQISS